MNHPHRMHPRGAGRFIVAVLLSSIMLYSCQKDDEEPLPTKPLPEAEYPYTYHVLSEAEWSARNEYFRQINTHNSLTLNEYGFVTGKIQLDETFVFDADGVIITVDTLVPIYREFMGIPDSSVVNAENELTATDLLIWHGHTVGVRDYLFDFAFPNFRDSPVTYNEITTHNFWFSQRNIANAKITENRLIFIFDENDKSVQINGNWFPEVFIPSADIYSETEAANIAIQSIKKDMEISGFDKGDLQEDIYEAKKYLYPLILEDRTEIHECWFFDLPISSGVYQVFVDTQTGEVLSLILAGYTM